MKVAELSLMRLFMLMNTSDGNRDYSVFVSGTLRLSVITNHVLVRFIRTTNGQVADIMGLESSRLC